MAFDAFFMLEGGTAGEIKGESLDDKFKGWIEPTSFSLGLENSINIGSKSAGAGAGKVSFNEFVIEKTPDATSPTLFLACCNGSHFDKGTLALRKTGGAAKEAGEAYLTYEFKQVMIASIEETGSEGDDLPSESIVMKFGAFKWIYRAQDQTGRLGAAVEKNWSQVLNKESFEVK